MSCAVSTRVVPALIFALALSGILACERKSAPSRAAGNGKIPITTKSEEARKEFLAGRALAEKLQPQDSLSHFDKALALDPDFALAELGRADSAPTAKDYFDHMSKAVALSSKVSEGERLLILSEDSDKNGNTRKQKEYLDRLIAAYPSDERAHFNLGSYYFGEQEFDQAIAEYRKAIELAPDFSLAYNILGYAYRQQGNYEDAERAFKKYIELIPADPNPYDSYAELLLKMGRYDQAIAQYRKALSVDPRFMPSYFGISAALMYQGKHDEAFAELQKMADGARNDGELRKAYFAQTVVCVDRGRLDKGLQYLQKEYEVAEKKKDLAAMAMDLQVKGALLLEMQNPNAAEPLFAQALQLIATSDLSPEVKQNATLQNEFNLAALALNRKNINQAKTHAKQFQTGAEASHYVVWLKQAHELNGRIALAEKDLDTAIAELEQSNLQDPRNLMRLSQAFEARGDASTAADYLRRAAHFNSLPQLNYALIRAKAVRELAANHG